MSAHRRRQPPGAQAIRQLDYNREGRRRQVELIPGYDDWKTAQPEEPDPVAFCAECDTPLWEDDVTYTSEGPMCAKCLQCHEDVV